MNRSTLGLFVTSALLLTGCGGSSGGGGGGGNVDLESLSGSVSGAGGVPLEAVEVEFAGMTAVTDANGLFILPMIGQLPVGPNLVHIDGSTTTAMGEYPALEVAVELEAGDTDVSLPQPIVLPDLSSPDAGNQSVGVDGTGATTEPIALEGPAGDIGLVAPTGTVVLLDDTPATGAVDFNVTPVPPTEVPMPLPDGLLASSFVTIQPAEGRFTTPGGTGLDTILPNDGDLPIGTMVDVWSFDHDEGDWVNRSEETGIQGEVVDLGLGNGLTGVQAAGVITEGGWHSPTIDVDPECATTVTGTVCDTSGNPLEDVTIATSFGQFVTTDDTGAFTVELVPAYDVTDPECPPLPFVVTATAPPVLGATTTGTVNVTAGEIVQNGTTVLAKIELVVPSTGCLAGLVTGTLADPESGVTISGPTSTTLDVGPSGTFSSCSLDPGSYSASAVFLGGTTDTVEFVIVANELTTIVLQEGMGGGSGDLTVCVQTLSDFLSGDAEPVEGALVFVEGTDSGSSGGIQGLTDANGSITFEDVDGPFRVTAFADSAFGSFVLREAVTATDLDPSDDKVFLTLFADLEGLQTDPPVLDANLSGSILNNPMNCAVNIQIQSRSSVLDQQFFDDQDGLTTAYSFDVPVGIPFDLIVTVDCGTGNSDTSSAGLILNVPALESDEQRTLDIDLDGAEFVDFDDVTQLAIVNEQLIGSALERSGALDVVDFPSGLAFEFELFSEQLAPSLVDLPPLTTGPFAGFDAFFGYETLGIDFSTQETSSQFSSLALGNTIPDTITMNLLDLPTLASPDLPFTTDSLGQETFQYVPPSTPGGFDGFDQIIVSGGSFKDKNPLFVFWNIYLEPGTSMFDFPAIAELIAQTGSYSATVSSARIDAPFDLPATFYTGGLGLPLAGVVGLEETTDLRQSSVGFPFEIVGASSQE